MCGIFGILGLTGPVHYQPGLVEQMGAAMRHRGPDDSGSVIEDRLILGMRRLSIIDVAGGHQPIANEDGTVLVVCNGEIYNFRQLRQRLESIGHRFKTHSDTEVIVHLYEEYGDRFLEHLDGMYGLALWDQIGRAHV
jgi:asparagine synthase (glutamine-hydrolysing)